MFIFAHRGLEREYLENTTPAFMAAAELGFGVELDIRLAKDGRLVCLHDPPGGQTTDATRFSDVVEQVIVGFQKGQKAAIHVKADEQGQTQLGILLELFASHQLYQKAFLFDLTFESAQCIRKADPRIEIAVSVGEKNYSPTIYTWEQAKERPNLFDAIWWDEWKISGSVYTEKIARAIHDAGKKIYAISPELHIDHDHPHAYEGYEQDWQNFIQWGIEGVCTAYPREFERILRR